MARKLEFKACLCYIMNSRLIWATWDTVSKIDICKMVYLWDFHSYSASLKNKQEIEMVDIHIFKLEHIVFFVFLEFLWLLKKNNSSTKYNIEKCVVSNLFTYTNKLYKNEIQNKHVYKTGQWETDALLSYNSMTK